MKRDVRVFCVNWNNGGRNDSLLVSIGGSKGLNVSSALWTEIRSRIDGDKVTSVWELK